MDSGSRVRACGNASTTFSLVRRWAESLLATSSDLTGQLPASEHVTLLLDCRRLGWRLLRPPYRGLGGDHAEEPPGAREWGEQKKGTSVRRRGA